MKTRAKVASLQISWNKGKFLHIKKKVPNIAAFLFFCNSIMAGRFDSSMFGCSKMINQNKRKTDLEQEPEPSVTSD